MKHNKVDEFNNVSVMGADTVKKPSIPIIAGVSALVLVGASVISYMLFIPSVKNAVRMATLEPNEYLEAVVKDNCSGLATSMAQSYDNKTQAYDIQNGLAYDYDLSIKLSDTLMDTLNQTIVGYSAEELPDNFPTKYDIKGKVNAKDNLTNASVELFADDTSIISANVVADVEGEKIYAQVPELSNAHMYLTPQEQSEEDDYYSYNIYDTYMEQFEKFSLNGMNIAEKGVTGKELGDTIVKYTNIIVDNLTGDTTLEKDVEGSVVSVSYKYNKVSTKVTSQDCLNIGNQVLDEMQSDEVVKTIIMDNGGITTDDEYSQLITDCKTDLNETFADDNTSMILNTYINSNGIICGFELVNENTSDKVTLIGAVDNQDYAIEFNTGTSIFQLTGTETDKDTYTGSMVITDTDPNETISLNYENLSVTDDGYINGKFTTDISSLEISDLSTITLEAIAGDKSQTVNMDFSGKLSLSSTVSLVDATEVSIPTGDMYDYNTQSQDYMATFNQNFADDTLKKLNLYDWYQEMLTSSQADYSYDQSNIGYDDINYDDDVSTYVDVDVDFNTLKINLNSEPFNLFDAPNSYIKSLNYGDDSYYNDTIYVIVKDDNIDYFKIYDDYDETTPDIPFDINGIKIGSSFEDINKTFGTDASLTNDTITITNSVDYSSDITFYLTDGLVEDITFFNYSY